MKVIKPVGFQPSMLISSNATETVAAWNSGTTYAKDAEVNYSDSIYVSLQSGNINNQPNLLSNSIWWIRKSANNKYSMFDEFINSQTSRPYSLTVSVKPGTAVNSVAIFNAEGVRSLTIVGTDGVGGPVVYSRTEDFDNTIIIDWYMYFFEPYSLKDQSIVQEIPPYQNIVLTFTFTSDTVVKVGNLVLGTTYSLGATQYGASAGIRDYSVKNVNEFGITTFVKRAFSKRTEVSLYVNKKNINFVEKLLTDIRATPVVWIGTEDEDYSPLTVYGYYRDFNIEISYPSFSLCRLEIEGLV